MARGINKVILIGNLGQDPDVRYSADGRAIANISVATTDSWKDKNTGERQDRTEWHRVVFFGKLAEIVAEYLKKGSQVYIEGRLQTRKWQDKSGQDRYTTEVVVDGFNGTMQMLDSRGGGKGFPAIRWGITAVPLSPLQASLGVDWVIRMMISPFKRGSNRSLSEGADDPGSALSPRHVYPEVALPGVWLQHKSCEEGREEWRFF